MSDGRTPTTVPKLRQVRPEGAATSVFERRMVCNGCGGRVTVCGAVSDLEPDGWRCYECSFPPRLWAARKRAPDGKAAA